MDAPTLIGGGLLLIEESALVVVDPGTGAELQRRALEGLSLSQVLVTSGGVYAVTEGRRTPRDPLRARELRRPFRSTELLRDRAYSTRAERDQRWPR